MALTGMGINVGLNLILIPEIQALGSAWASLVTQLFTALAQTILAVHFLKLHINYRLIAKLIVFVGFVFLAGFLSKQINNWIAGYLIMVSVSVLFAFFTRLINLKALSEIIQNKQSV
jgi:O-antigen/teichoic acid export membrane protein